MKLFQQFYVDKCFFLFVKDDFFLNTLNWWDKSYRDDFNINMLQAWDNE